MTTFSLVDVYQKGAITADHLVVQCLLLIDPADPRRSSAHCRTKF